MVRFVPALLAALVLSGCGVSQREQCRYQAGPEPDSEAARAFGVLGIFAASATDPERRAWNERFNACYWGGQRT